MINLLYTKTFSISNKIVNHNKAYTINSRQLFLLEIF